MGIWKGRAQARSGKIFESGPLSSAMFLLCNVPSTPYRYDNRTGNKYYQSEFKRQDVPSDGTAQTPLDHAVGQ